MAFFQFFAQNIGLIATNCHPAPLATGGSWFRRAYFEEHLPIKEIARRLPVSRVTVRKVVRGEAARFKYDPNHNCVDTSNYAFIAKLLI